jgi:hypothetical protein
MNSVLLIFVFILGYFTVGCIMILFANVLQTFIFGESDMDLEDTGSMAFYVAFWPFILAVSLVLAFFTAIGKFGCWVCSFGVKKPKLSVEETLRLKGVSEESIKDIIQDLDDI